MSKIYLPHGQARITRPSEQPIAVKKVRCLIAMPMYDSIKCRCLKSFTEFIRDMTHSPKFSCDVMYNDGTYLDQNREELSDRAIKGKFDYLFFIDSDMIFPPTVLDKLYDRHKDVVGGIYTLRCGVNHRPCMYDYRKKEGDFVQWRDWPVNKCMKVGGIGTGMLLIKVEALKKIPYPRFSFMPAKTPDENGDIRRLGEDLSFCVRCYENNIKIYADTSMDIRHWGTKAWGFKDWQMAKLIRELKLDDLKGFTIG